MIPKKLFLWMLLLVLGLNMSVYAEGSNIALGKSYTFSLAPNYPLCTDPNDIVQLTDGENVVGPQFWSDKRCVGWRKPATSIEITIDLEKVQPIKGVSYNTAAGNADVFWSRAIFIFVSDDGINYYYVDELITSCEGMIPPTFGYTVNRFKSCKLETKGRYVKFVIIPSGHFCFVDEIEVFKGPQEYLTKSPGDKVDNINKFLQDNLTDQGIARRIRQDIFDLMREITKSNILQDEKESLIAELRDIEPRIKSIPRQIEPSFRAIMPLNSLHKEVYRVNAKYAKAKGLEGVMVWKNNRWDMLLPTALPDTKDIDNNTKLEMAMMQNEFRSEAFNITNITESDLMIKLTFDGMPGGLIPDYITVHQVEFVDTRETLLLADALPIAKKTKEGFEIYVPSGMTRQVWLTFNPIGIEPSTYNSKISLDLGNNLGKIDVPLEFRVSSIVFPEQPSISLGMWDYTDDLRRDLPEGARDEAIQNMKEHFVDTPWGLRGTAPWPSSIQVVEDEIYMEMDFSKFDKWVSDWQGARNYNMYLNVGNTFGPSKTPMNDPNFQRFVSHWASEWSAHVKEIGLDPSQIALLLIDEPTTNEEANIIITWGKAIKAGAPDFVIWEDPLFVEPWNINPEFFEVCDVLCPSIPYYYRDKTENFYKELQDAGKRLWFYQCSNGRVWDPYSYHRLTEWIAWKHGAVGVGFWSYSSAGGTSPWNEYLALGKTSYTPVYFDNNSIVDGKHWEAVREGIEDYEYMKILSDTIKKLDAQGYTGEILNEAKILLSEAPERVCGIYETRSIRWWISQEKDFADLERIKVLNMIEELSDLK